MDGITAVVTIAAIVFAFAAVVVALLVKGDVEAAGHVGSGSFSLKVKERRQFRDKKPKKKPGQDR